VNSLQTVCVGCWLIKSDLKHDARSAQRHNKELHRVRNLCHVVTAGVRWDGIGWDKRVDGMENKKEYHWLNDNDTGKPKQANRTLHHCHFVHQRSHMERPGKELAPLW
jgi:hypothetical protein